MIIMGLASLLAENPFEVIGKSVHVEERSIFGRQQSYIIIEAQFYYQCAKANLFPRD
jgi:hypothetical protein